MKTIPRILVVVTTSSLFALGVFAASPSSAPDDSRASDPANSPHRRATDADNTARNAQDRDEHAVTPLNQGNSKADLGITQSIRKQIVNTKGLSTNAKNIKVITANGHVTLRGPVDTAEEKQIVTGIAASVAPAENVDSQLEVKTDASGK